MGDSGPEHPHPSSSRTCKHLYSTKATTAAVYSAPKGRAPARARSRWSLGGDRRRGSVASGPTWALSPAEDGRGGSVEPGPGDPWAALASLQKPSLIPECARRSGLGRSPRTPGSADTSSNPSKPANGTDPAIAGHRTMAPEAPELARSPAAHAQEGRCEGRVPGHARRSRPLNVWAGHAY